MLKQVDKCLKWWLVYCSVVYLTFTPASSYSNVTSSRMRLDEILNKNSEGVNKVAYNKLMEFWPGFYPHENVTEACWNECISYIKDLQTFRLHALKMWDASAKISSGILNGNVNQYGDYDLCMEGGGRYCLAYLQLDLTRSDLVTIDSMIHSNYAFRSSLDDTSHITPLYSTIHWGLCVPRSCTPRDVELTLRSTLSSALAKTGLVFKARVSPAMCPSVPREALPKTTILAGLLFGLLLILILWATIHDFTDDGNDKKIKSIWIKAGEGFSLRRNVNKLLELRESSDDITAVHGIRLFNAIMLYLSHKAITIFYNPFVNRTQMSLLINASWTTMLRAASVYTDPFTMMSGLLTSYTLLKSTAPLKFHKEIISRLLRLLPALVAVMAFYACIVPHIGSGPQWPIVENQAKICQKYWWRNLLLIQNYFGSKNMCQLQSHHVATDTQLFIVCLFVILFLLKWPRKCLQFLMAAAVASTVLRFYSSYANDLSLFIYFGIPVKKMFDVADYSYFLPTHRATVYIMGIVLGYILRHTGREYHLKKSVLGMGWMIALGCFYFSFLHWSNMCYLSYTYNSLDAAIYSAFTPITSCIFFAWIIFITHTGNSFGLLSKILENKWLLVTTRLAYSFYLTQFPIFYYNAGRARSSSYFTIFFIADLLEFIAALIITVLLTLFVEMPFQNIRSLLFPKDENRNASLNHDKVIISNDVTHDEFIDPVESNDTASKLHANGLHKVSDMQIYEPTGISTKKLE